MTTVIGFDAQQAFGAVGAQFGARTAVVLGAAESALIPRGWHLVECDAHTSVRFTYDAGSTFVTWIAASGVGVVWSDGKNVSFLADGTGGTAHRSAILGA